MTTVYLFASEHCIVSVIDGIVHRVRVLLRGEAYAREQEREVRFHLELESLAHTSRGTPAHDAELAARGSFGNVGYYREEMRAMTPLAPLDRLRQNLGYAARGLRRSPGFSLAVIATIALGAGFNASMFSLLDRVLLRAPRGVASPFALRRLYIDPGYSVTNRGSHVFPYFSYANYRAVRDAARSADVLAYTSADSLGFNDGAVTGHLSFASSNYFALLGVRPIVGRVFGSEEAPVERPTPVMVISERLWRHGFSSDPGVLGRVIRVGRLRPTIIGIVPAEFSGLDINGADAWMPLNMFDGGRLSGPGWYNGGGNFLTVVARPRDAAAESELRALGALGIRAVQSQLTGKPDQSTLLDGSVLESVGPAEEAEELTLSTRIAGVAAIILFIACANVATLLLVRATRRRREIAVRRALGASRGRLYEQLLVESVLLAGLGGVAALGLATWGGALLRTSLFPRVNWVSGTMDWRVAGFIALVVLLVGVIAGLVPAASSSRDDVMHALRAGGPESASRRSLLSSALLGFQAALCVVLVVGAGLFVRSYANVRSIDVGFDPNGIVFGGLPSSPEKQWGPETTPLLEQAAAGLRSFPGVKGTALATPAPMAGMAMTRLYRPNGDSLFRFGREFPAYTAVTPEFFSTVGVRLVTGRLFTTADRAEAPHVVIVSRKMARLVWPDAAPIGQCLVVGQRSEQCTTVVGVVEDTHRMEVVAAPGIQFYLPLAQVPGSRAPSIIVRTDPSRVSAVMLELAAQLRRNVDGARLVFARSLGAVIGSELRSWRLGATLFTAFGLLALCVAAIGIYSVVAYAVSQRTHEMGVRLALGATLRDILNLVVLDRMLVVGAGVAAGIAGALFLGRFVTSLLFGVTASDPSTLLGAAALLTGIAIAASLVPAWRAARIDPATALRAD